MSNPNIMNMHIIDTLARLLPARRRALFAPLFRRFIATKSGRTRELYECTLRKLQGYEPRLERMPVTAVTHEWLLGFEAYLARTAPKRNARNTVTDIYIDFDSRKIHTANRKIIRHVFGAVEGNHADPDNAESEE